MENHRFNVSDLLLVTIINFTIPTIKFMILMTIISLKSNVFDLWPGVTVSCEMPLACLDAATIQGNATLHSTMKCNQAFTPRINRMLCTKH